MADIFFLGVFDSKIIDHHGELDRLAVMLPPTGGLSDFIVIVSGRAKFFLEVVLDRAACLGDAVDGVADLNVDQLVFGLFAESILFDNVLREVRKFHSHVFGTLQKAAKVNILDVQAYVFCIFSAENTIPQDL